MPIPKPLASKETPGVERKINTEAMELVHRDLKHHRLWSIQAKKSYIHYSNQGKTKGVLYQAEGTLFENDQKACHFRADQAMVDEFQNTLTLEGHIDLVTEQTKISLKADKILWMGLNKKIKATGNVFVESPQYFIGPSAELLADAQLNQVGTPGTFKESK